MLSTSARDRVLAVGAALVLAIVGGVAVGQGQSIAPIDLPRELLTVTEQTVVWLFIAADVLLLIGIVYALTGDRPAITGEPRKFSLFTYLFALVPTVIVFALLWLRPRGASPLILLPRPLGAGMLPFQAAGARTTSGSADVTWVSILLAALIVVGFLSWLFWPTRRPHPRQAVTPPPAVGEEMVEAIDESIDALAAIRDPRRAIIAAYSAMEVSIARAGVQRRKSDTPLEFLMRISRSAVEIAGDARRLTYLFELAKFSQHDVDDSMRSDALGALRQIRERLTGGAVS